MGMLPFVCKRLSLADTETVLFVRHYKAQPVKLNLFLNQRVSADNKLCLPALDSGIGLPLLFRCHGTCKENRFHFFLQPAVLQQLRHRLSMLSGKHFRRSHQRSLVSVFRRRKQGQHRYHGLPGAHVSLDQPVHDRLAGQIRLNLLPDALLGPCQRIGQGLKQMLRPFSRTNRTVILLSFRLLFHLPQSQDKEKELVKNQAFPRQQQILPPNRKVYGPKGKIILCQLLIAPDLGRQIFRIQLQLIKGLADCLGNRLVGKACSQPINGLHRIQQRFIIRRGIEIRLLHHQPALFLLDSSTEDIGAARHNTVAEKRHVEPAQMQIGSELLQRQGRHCEPAHPFRIRRPVHKA